MIWYRTWRSAAGFSLPCLVALPPIVIHDACRSWLGISNASQPVTATFPLSFFSLSLSLFFGLHILALHSFSNLHYGIIAHGLSALDVKPIPCPLRVNTTRFGTRFLISSSPYYLRVCSWEVCVRVELSCACIDVLWGISTLFNHVLLNLSAARNYA